MKKLFICAAALAVVATSATVQAQECCKSKAATSTVALQQVEQEAEPMDIVDTAAGTEAFSTLVAAVKAAGLVEVLKGEGPFTVFAPTNEAFAKLPEGTVEKLLLPENREQLVAILKYHVVSGKVMAADAAQLETAETVLGKNLTITSGVRTLMVNGANIVASDVACSNGVIHVVDSVIIPPADAPEGSEARPAASGSKPAASDTEPAASDTKAGAGSSGR